MNFFIFFLFKYFLRIRNQNADPGGKLNADPCRSGFTALIKTNLAGTKYFGACPPEPVCFNHLFFLLPEGKEKLSYMTVREFVVFLF